MSFIHEDHVDFHDGEKRMRSLLQVPPGENPTSDFLTPQAAFSLQNYPLLAIGTLDALQRPWTTIWGGEPGFARPLSSSIVGIKTLVDPRFDPVVEALVGGRQDGEVVKEEGQGRLFAGLTIDLMKRKRVKLGGRMVAGALGQIKSHPWKENAKIAQVQLVFNIQESLGNCPKYLNKKEITASLPEPVLISDSLPLPNEAIKLLDKADMFFVSSSDHEFSMDTNHRGGPPGFVRVLENGASGVTLVYPEYSGNRLYQTLGNLQTTPKAGFVIPDFDTGDVLYITGDTSIHIGSKAASLLPHSNVVIEIKATGARFVQRGLPFRGKLAERSPYNPRVRFLNSERAAVDAVARKSVTATLIRKDHLSPSIARFRFRISDPATAGKWTAGQYVALSFEDELGAGYSHMREDDPRSLNDDYTRTFTVSSTPGELPEDEFEITVRNVGVVTNFMFRHNPRAGLEVPLIGFGGEFKFDKVGDRIVPFVAGGIGITPLLGQLSTLDASKVRCFWTVNIRDIGLVEDTFTRNPSLASSTALFISGNTSSLSGNDALKLKKIGDSNTHVEYRRLLASDLQSSPFRRSNGAYYTRPPPSLRPHYGLPFPPTPEGFFEGTFYDVWTSRTPLIALRNVQTKSSTDTATGIIVDIASFQIAECNYIFTSYVTLTPPQQTVDTWTLGGAGTTASLTGTVELVAYGTDTDGYAFYVTYGPGPTFGLIFASKNKGIRSEAIFEAVLTALEEMGDPVIQDLVITGVFISIDGERDGLPEPTCGQSCQDNEVRPEGWEKEVKSGFDASPEA
ncbi:MAG: hypothetical protein MMC33_001021 [Icmadophila ericetorum]|nr:hypothetical protein [Icmadophila ericetorum]